jgi:3-methyladenine DNA glycosylase AlkD
MNALEIITELKAMATPEHLAQLSRFGINDSAALGIRVPALRKFAKLIGVNHELAIELWKTGIHEARILASMIADSKLMTEELVEEWVSSFNSWDLCDVTCDLLGRTPFVLQLIDKYSARNEEFVKRTAFALMCELAFHDKKTSNEQFFEFFKIIEREAWDNRNFVRKAVNWALRQIGKRNETLRLEAIEVGERVLMQGTKSARWIATDALRELNSEKVISYVARRKRK